MDYSTFNSKNFFIKKDSTLPELKYPLIQQIREKYGITDDMLESCAITFSMINEDGLYRIANVAGKLLVNNDRVNYPAEEKYTLAYRFKLKDTKKAGRFLGEFKMDFIVEGDCGTLTLPTNDKINIIISDSLTKTTVI